MDEEFFSNIDKCQAAWRDDYGVLLMRLESVHSAFRFLVDNASPMFDDICDTACLLFNKDSKDFSFHINPSFWLSNQAAEFRAFVIAHESYHAFMDHGIRSANLDNELANIAQDIVINELLGSQFFDRAIIDPASMYCWYDTVLADIPYERGQNFEYYYNLLKQNKDKIHQKWLIGSHGTSSGQGNVDGEGGGGGVPDNERPIERADLDNFIEKINEEGGGGILAGNLPGGISVTLGKIVVPKKKKWESVIEEWVGLRIKKKEKTVSHWIGKDRRMMLLDHVLMIPSSRELEEKDLEQDKIDLWFFQDTSGSCASFAKRFFKAANSIPTERFDIRTFCFDTSVYETDLKSGKLYGFGGTSFDILEERIQKEIKSKKLKKYPDAIFVITDGYGDYIYPQLPKNWYWFLGGSSTTKRYIPKESKTFMLKDYE